MRKKFLLFQQIKIDANDIANCICNKDPSKWYNDDIRGMIQTKDPNIPSLSAVNKKDLVEMWEKKYSMMGDFVPEEGWTNRDERWLKHLEEGKIESIDQTGIYKRSIVNCCGFLHLKLENIPRSHALALAMEVFLDEVINFCFKIFNLRSHLYAHTNGTKPDFFLSSYFIIY